MSRHQAQATPYNPASVKGQEPSLAPPEKQTAIHQQIAPEARETIPVGPVCPDAGEGDGEEPSPRGRLPLVKGQLERAVIVGLAGWVDSSVRKLGRERTRAIIEIAAKAGYLAPEVRDILVQLLDLSHEETLPQQVEMREALVTFFKLDRILGHNTEAAVALSLLEEEPWIRP